MKYVKIFLNNKNFNGTIFSKDSITSQYNDYYEDIFHYSFSFDIKFHFKEGCLEKIAIEEGDINHESDIYLIFYNEILNIYDLNSVYFNDYQNTFQNDKIIKNKDGIYNLLNKIKLNWSINMKIVLNNIYFLSHLLFFNPMLHFIDNVFNDIVYDFNYLSKYICNTNINFLGAYNPKDVCTFTTTFILKLNKINNSDNIIVFNDKSVLYFVLMEIDDRVYIKIKDNYIFIDNEFYKKTNDKFLEILDLIQNKIKTLIHKYHL